jgi:hypothetical protein
MKASSKYETRSQLKLDVDFIDRWASIHNYDISYRTGRKLEAYNFNFAARVDVSRNKFPSGVVCEIFIRPAGVLEGIRLPPGWRM